VKYLALAWAIAAYLLFTDARNVRDYLAMASRLGLRGEAQAATPLRQPFPAFAPDAQVWIRHSLSLVEGDEVRLRHTDIDNAPMGRDVHWNSGWAWAIAGAGQVHRAATGLPLPQATERAAMWLNPVALFMAILLFSSWTLRRLGVVPAIFITAAMALQARLLEGFFPYYVDHHGLLAMSVLGLVLGATAMLRGVRGAEIFSALAGAFGLWVSAASVIPAIAVTAIAAAIVAPPDADARAWRMWGAVGAAAALAFYAFEYFPNHMALRLEVNHPLYAIAWLAAGELVARRMQPAGRNRAQRWWPWIALLALPATMAMGGAAVLSFTDPFMARLHAQHIREFLPMWKALAEASPATIVRICVLEAVPLVAALVTLAILRRRSPRLLVFTTLIAAPLLAMAWWQARWQLNASAAGVVLALVLVETWTANRDERMRALAAAAVAAILFLPGGWDRYYSAHAAVAARIVNPGEAQMALARDVAAVLRSTQPSGDITLLASPNGSTSVGYYGRFRTLGTLYWENAEGLKAAAAIFSTADDSQAERLIRARRVTHVAMFSDENFIEPYLVLSNPQATPQMLQRSFGWRLLTGAEIPAWLEPIPYEAPPDLRVLNNPVRLYRVRERLQFAKP